MATTTTRHYHAKDVEMLTAAKTIVETATSHLTELVVIRPNWKNPYLPDLKTRIDSAFSNILGLDPLKDQRAATNTVMSIFAPADRNLALFKQQVLIDFKKDRIRRDEILNTTGITTFLKKVQKGDQEALIQLLYQFKANVTAAITTELTTKGMASILITTIKGYADTLKNANITQETLKSTAPDITEAGIKELNGIYDEIIGIARISAKFYLDKPTIKDQFTFSQLIKRLNNQGGKGDSGNENNPPPAPTA